MSDVSAPFSVLIAALVLYLTYGRERAAPEIAVELAQARVLCTGRPLRATTVALVPVVVSNLGGRATTLVEVGSVPGGDPVVGYDARFQASGAGWGGLFTPAEFEATVLADGAPAVARLREGSQEDYDRLVASGAPLMRYGLGGGGTRGDVAAAVVPVMVTVDGGKSARLVVGVRTVHPGAGDARLRFVIPLELTFSGGERRQVTAVVETPALDRAACANSRR